MRRRTWFHLSAIDHGAEMLARRRPPLLRTASEPLTPRVCVCPTLAGCVSAILLERGPGYVYTWSGRTNPPSGVWDATITGERWVVTPATLKFHMVLEEELVRELYLPTLLKLSERKKPLSWKARVAQYVHAAQILRSGQKLAAWMRERILEGKDPVTVILEQV